MRVQMVTRPIAFLVAAALIACGVGALSRDLGSWKPIPTKELEAIHLGEDNDPTLDCCVKTVKIDCTTNSNFSCGAGPDCSSRNIDTTCSATQCPFHPLTSCGIAKEVARNVNSCSVTGVTTMGCASPLKKCTYTTMIINVFPYVCNGQNCPDSQQPTNTCD